MATRGFLKLMGDYEIIQSEVKEDTSQKDFFRLLENTQNLSLVDIDLEDTEDRQDKRRFPRQNWDASLKIFQRDGVFLSYGTVLDVSRCGLGLLIDNSGISLKRCLEIVIPVDGQEPLQALCEVVQTKSEGRKQFLGLRILEMTKDGTQILDQVLAV